jgi:hypothetical protein
MGAIPYAIQPYDTLWLIAQRYHTTINSIAAANPGINLNYLRVGQVIYIRPGHGLTPSGTFPPSEGISKAELDLNNAIRKLWEEHVTWTRLAILSLVFSLPDADVVINRLFRNPVDFEILLRPLYGTEKAAKFRELFKSHLVIAAQLVKAAKSGNSKAASDAEKSWYANADEIAAFLASINPYWSEENWKAMLYKHLAMTKSEAVQMLTKGYSASVKQYDEIENQALVMADVMTEGILKQFPDKF